MADEDYDALAPYSELLRNATRAQKLAMYAKLDPRRYAQELGREVMPKREIPEYDDGPRMLEDMEMLKKLHRQEEAPVATATRRHPYANELSRRVTHPDGFVEFDEEVFPDPERDQIMGDTWQALRRAASKNAMAEREEAERRGRQDPNPTLGPSMTE